MTRANNNRRKMQSTVQEQTAAQEGAFIRGVRDLAGVLSVLGMAVLTGYAVANLKPGWQWTVEAEKPVYRTQDEG
ncbi:hypothetical protein LLE49_09520 [Alicyclobacillus tolerans]|uniref:hypothetical protein n=1 Tax=Alicyclobacillus tolerans TaxID=90970 RepID=UPI001F293FEC|nr:hypothetical protein [Alicyclobacillus tolerans]MCF8564958.1 hypothetical protein [Alicyclobacillus tolerans]